MQWRTCEVFRKIARSNSEGVIRHEAEDGTRATTGRCRRAYLDTFLSTIAEITDTIRRDTSG
jgi:hypothetical protein